ncbi:UDP-2,4-diacetamido-2,4,6-trideoxy-beta-L-altropyranose hydrolase [Uliginosibacterium aquaticum]|uniref:UDP-2,4-diacetamido-2,4, 6-trideoxy-beta-L-altropyranose hydrolase n=1 Tax=Uliginosibacterium aquaticum TaxID=2731212 RepID=A0ABX2IM14_9RHOO|nr:UDP-2,4-diacetamido-2,4,6-trideoxy-beta-L-altropyranose hydrolase [Uliginosibacterium aquaticum]NSL55170.1 UDP-2,4-diacetamido-2,4,6-trideoxy-beta-L-altropyranose hydrolase [Uliginosibacterium aquaticum]
MTGLVLPRRIGRVAFRCDASLTLGSGHVMRCLTLAQALQAEGSECHFLCRAEPGHLLAPIRAAGFSAHELPASEAFNQEQDAADCRTLLEALRPDWLFTDHYALTAIWEEALRDTCQHLLVIDDLANRLHVAELLLDQNLGRVASDYAALLPATSRVLVGPHYALLRDEFAAARKRSLRHRQQPALKQLMISLGGADADNLTGEILQALHSAALPADCRMTVILGAANPWQAEVRALATQMPCSTEVKIAVPDMARHLASTDLVIGAAGGSAWERCCLGVPSVLLIQAENQRAGTQALVEVGAALLASSPAELPALLAQLDPPLLGELSTRAAALCDGLGTQRVLQAMKELT